MDKNKIANINKPPVKFNETRKIINDIEKKLNSTLICYWNSENGEICGNDVYVFNEIIKKIKLKDDLYIFVKSDGGRGTQSLRIINLLRNYVKKIYALVPLECCSAATILVLGANEIHMGPLAYLSAVDTSIEHNLAPVDRYNRSVSVSQDELIRVIKLWNKENKGKTLNPYQSLYAHMHPLVFGAVDRASSLSIKLCKEILSYHLKDSKKVNKISNHLNSNYPSHNYPITFIEAKKIGLNVKKMDDYVNEKLLLLNNIYSEMGQKALTDYDESNYHDNEIVNITESKDIQIFFQTDKDWHYRKEERRWVSMNDRSSWRKNSIIEGKKSESILHIR